MSKISARGVAAAFLVVLVAGVCIRLGFWQLGRLEQRREFNAHVSAAMARPAIELDEAAIEAITTTPDAYRNRSFLLRGRFVEGSTILLRGRSDHGRPGVHLVMPLELDDGRAVLVNLGWVPAPDAATVDPEPFEPSGPATLLATFQAMPDPDDGGAPVVIRPAEAEVLTLRRLHHPSVQARTPLPVLPLYFQLSPDPGATATPPVPVALPPLDDGPHLGYALQWFGFAAVALIGFLVVVVRGGVRGA